MTKLRIVVPGVLILAYWTASFLLLGSFGGAGHGWGIGVFLDISLPAILVAMVVDSALPHHDLTVWLGLLVGTLQYALVGYVVSVLLTRKHK